jgi:hypothetical protein
VATVNDAQAQAYRLANPDIAYNPSAAVTKKWLALKAAGTYIGVPIGAEVQIGPNETAQAFTSGVVLHWHGGDNVTVE